jgi:hypothetical protein
MNIIRMTGLVVALMGSCAAAQAQQPDLILPEIPAIELPQGVTQIGPGDSPLKELLAAAHCGDHKVTADLKRKLGPGMVKVTWSCWDGAPGAGKPSSTRAGHVYILPWGYTPVGVTTSETATAANNAVHIARDSKGAVHMVWKDSGQPSGKTGPAYRRVTVGANGAVKFDTGIIHVADDSPGDWNSYPALAVMGQNVQMIWQGGGTVRTRRVSFGAGGWTMGPIVDTQAHSEGRDVGPDIAFDAKGGLHIVTPSGIYAFSGDDGKTWKVEPVPLPPHNTVKTASLAPDASGAVHLAFSAPVTRDPSPGKVGMYWQLLTIDRDAGGKWGQASDALAQAPGWGEPKGADDVLADWVRIAADSKGGLHLAWHGTVLSRKYGNDTAFYSWKRPGAATWQTPLALVHQDLARGIRFSYSPSLVLDGDRVMPLVFYEIDPSPEVAGYDSVLASLRGGRVERPVLPVSQFVQAAIAAKQPDTAMGSRSPAASPGLWHSPDGHAWLDVLELLQSPAEPKGINIIAYHRLDLTAQK